MKWKKYVLVLAMVGSWLTLPFVGRGTLQRFGLAGFFISLFVFAEDLLAARRNWWQLRSPLPPIRGIMPLILGPFLVGTIWILKLTYGKFFRYILANLGIDSLFVYLVMRVLERYEVGTLKKLSKVQLSFLFFLKSLLLYGVQFLVERRRYNEGRKGSQSGLNRSSSQ